MPTLNEQIETETWTRISEDLLEEGDRTTEGQPSNDAAVEAFLRGESNYAGRWQHDGKIIQGNIIDKLEALVWDIKGTNTIH